MKLLDFSRSSTEELLVGLMAHYKLFSLPCDNPKLREEIIEFRRACVEEIQKRFEQESKSK